MKKGNLIIYDDLGLITSEHIDWASLSGKTVLVSGANGFIPSYIVEVLLYLNDNNFVEETIQVIGIARNAEKANHRLSHLQNRSDFRLIITDISQPIVISDDIDIIIHAASQASPKYFNIDPVGTLKANTIGTANLLELSKEKEIDKFLFISSGEVYGVVNSSRLIDESDTGNVDITNVRSCYAESKRVGETMCVSWGHQFGFHVNMIRLAHTYGPGVSLNDGRVFADFVRNVLDEQDIQLNSDGSAKRCFLYITDMIRALFYVLFYGSDGDAYNISSQKETSILELAMLMKSICHNKKLEIKFNSESLNSNYITSKSTNIHLSVEKLRKLGWDEKIDLFTGFSRMVKSYQI